MKLATDLLLAYITTCASCHSAGIILPPYPRHVVPWHMVPVLQAGVTLPDSFLAGPCYTNGMQADIDHVLIDRHAISTRLDALAKTIAADLQAETEEGSGEITFVPILTGSIIFLADLIRRLPIPMQIRVMSVTSYPGSATSSRGASIEAALTKLPDDLSRNHVLVIDDILDSGNTLRLVKQTIEQRNPISLRTCVLLRKMIPSARSFDVDYVAFDIPDEFVVGYGLDFNDYYRNLPDIVTLKKHVYAQVGQHKQ